MSARYVALALCLLAAAGSARPEDGLRVVVHPANPVATLTRAQASALFLKKTKRWPGGDEVRPIEPRDDRLQRAFCEAIHGKNAGAIRAYWNQQIFSGRGVPPDSASEAEVVERVSSDRAAVGYVSPRAVTGGVKVVTIQD